MSVTITLLLPGTRVPAASEVAESVRAVERSFHFDGEYDFDADEGWCPCRFGRKACGFEWSKGAPEAGEEAALVATLSYRSSELDAKCAVTVAAHLAALTGARLVAPDGFEVDAGGALAWASSALRDIRRQAAAKAKLPKVPPEETARAWLETIRGRDVTFLFRADPDMRVCYATGGVDLVVSMRRWTVVGIDGSEAGTTALGRQWTAAQVRDYPATFDKLRTVLESGPVLDAALDMADVSITIRHPGGTLRVLADGTVPLAGAEQLFRMFDAWELRRREPKGFLVRPNDERTGLEYR